jgi:hypothetical protein
VDLPRVSRHQYGAGRLVSLKSLRAGDLLFAKDTSDRRTIYHFQRARGLAPDGVVGAHTWGALVSSGRMRSQARC